MDPPTAVDHRVRFVGRPHPARADRVLVAAGVLHDRFGSLNSEVSRQPVGEPGARGEARDVVGVPQMTRIDPGRHRRVGRRQSQHASGPRRHERDQQGQDLWLVDCRAAGQDLDAVAGGEQGLAGWVRRREASGVVREPQQGVVLQVAAHPGQVVPDGHAQCGELVRGPDARAQQDRGAAERSRAQDDLAGVDPVAAAHLDARRPAVLDEDALDRPIRPDGQVRTPPAPRR